MTKTRVTTLTSNPSEVIARIEALCEVHRINVCGQEVVWRRFGSGPPLVLIHGGHGSWLHWVRNIELLLGSHTLWLPDLPGFGDSDALPGEDHATDRFERLVTTLCACVEQLFGSDAPILLAGFSFGGLVAANVAARCGNVEKLALLGPAGHGGVRRQSLEMLNWRVDNPVEAKESLRHNLRALMLHDDARIDSLAMEVHERACLATRFRSKAISRHALLAEALEEYQGPTLFVWGEHDVTAEPYEAAQRLAADISSRDWCLVPGAGHWVQYERPDEVNVLLLRWFSPVT